MIAITVVSELFNPLITLAALGALFERRRSRGA